MIKKILIVGLFMATVGCTPIDNQPIETNAPVVSAPAISTPEISVTVYTDTNGCQYLVFNDLGPYGTISVVPRLRSATNGMCVTS